MSGKRFAPRIDAALLLGLPRAMWVRLLVLRVLLNTAMQGAVFLNLSCLPVAQWAGVGVHLLSEFVN